MWSRLAVILDVSRVLTVADLDALRLLCLAHAEFAEADAIIGREGLTYASSTDSGGTILRPHPAVAIRADAWRRCRAMLVEFGLTPAARGKVSAISEAEGADPAAAYFGDRVAR